MPTKTERDLILNLSPETVLSIIEGNETDPQKKEEILDKNIDFLSQAQLGMIYLNESNFEDPHWGAKVIRAKILQKAVDGFEMLDEDKKIERIRRYTNGLISIKSRGKAPESLKGELAMVYELINSYAGENRENPF